MMTMEVLGRERRSSFPEIPVKPILFRESRRRDSAGDGSRRRRHDGATCIPTGHREGIVRGNCLINS
jgi:hypothetical protein